MHVERAAFFSIFALLSCLLTGSCTRFGAVYPSRPAPQPGVPAADPVPSRVVAHVAITSAALREALDDAIPKTGDGELTLLRSQRRYMWERAPVAVSFSQGRVVL